MDKPPLISNNFVYSPQGRALTESFEGLELVAYQDIAGVWTIGYGHTGPEVRAGYIITQSQADALVEIDTHIAAATVNHLVTVPLNQNQFDSLVDFTYNIGCGAFATSTLLKTLNTGDYPGAVAQFRRWIQAGGKSAEGLIRRRAAEAALFQEPV